MTTDFDTAILAGRIEPGMSFSQRALAVCSRIPEGRVATYAQIAKALGAKSARAIGGAMHRNHLAPRVPCHRVVGTNRTLTGYAHGLDQKRAILMKEGAKFEGDRIASESILCVDDLMSDSGRGL